MSKLIRAKAAYVTGKGQTKGGFHFSIVAEYQNTEKEASYRKFSTIFYPSRADLKAENLGIDFGKLLKDRKESYVIAKCPYTPTQLKFILSNLRRIAANFDDIKQCTDKKTGQLKDVRHLKDDESGQYFAKEIRFIERIDFVNFNEIYPKEQQHILVADGENKV
jgi:hypothetical protein